MSDFPGKKKRVRHNNMKGTSIGATLPRTFTSESRKRQKKKKVKIQISGQAGCSTLPSLGSADSMEGKAAATIHKKTD